MPASATINLLSFLQPNSVQSQVYEPCTDFLLETVICGCTTTGVVTGIGNYCLTLAGFEVEKYHHIFFHIFSITFLSAVILESFTDIWWLSALQIDQNNKLSNKRGQFDYPLYLKILNGNPGACLKVGAPSGKSWICQKILQLCKE